MAYNERDGGRGPEWRGDEGFGGGWGNQVPRPHELVKEHMEVTGADGGHVGTVDCTRDDRIILTKSDEAAGGAHHSLPCAWIESVDDKVVLNIDSEEARRRWHTEDRSRALFEREDLGRRGPHVLNRSFAGTYPDEE
jgi:hypothetical protein